MMQQSATVVPLPGMVVEQPAMPQPTTLVMPRFDRPPEVMPWFERPPEPEVPAPPT